MTAFAVTVLFVIFGALILWGAILGAKEEFYRKNMTGTLLELRKKHGEKVAEAVLKMMFDSDRHGTMFQIKADGSSVCKIVIERHRHKKGLSIIRITLNNPILEDNGFTVRNLLEDRMNDEERANEEEWKFIINDDNSTLKNASMTISEILKMCYPLQNCTFELVHGAYRYSSMSLVFGQGSVQPFDDEDEMILKG